MKPYSRLVALFLVAGTEGAFAADLAVKAPAAPPPGWVWCGFLSGRQCRLRLRPRCRKFSVDVKVNQTIDLLAPSVETASISSTQAGWTVGAGFEYMVSRNWSVKGEYLYVDLGTASAQGALTPAFAGFSYTQVCRPSGARERRVVMA